MMRYPEYTDSGVEWLDQIPRHWRVVAFKRCASIKSRLVDPRLPEYSSMTLIAPNHIESGTGRILGRETAAEQGADSGKYLYRNGDILYSKIRPELAKACILGDVGLCSADMYPLTPQSDVDARFLLYVLLSHGFTDQAILSSDRVAMPKVNRETLGAFVVPQPPLSEQVRIADFLDEKTAQIDTLIQKKRALIDLLREQRTALINRVVTKGLDPDVPMKDSGIEWLGDVPEHWQTPFIRFVARMDSGHTPSRSAPEYWEDCTIPWVSLKDTKTLALADYIRDTHTHISELGMASSSAHLIPTGAVVFTRDATIGLAAITEREMAVSQHIIAWICGDRVDNRYLLHVLYAIQEELESLTMGATIKTIGMPDLKELRMPLPPRKEQERIASYLFQRRGQFDKVVGREEQGLNLLRELRASLISEVVTGKIDVRHSAASCPGSGVAA